jgi:hypothetical protein
MKRIKQVISIILCVLLLAGCGKDEKTTESGSGSGGKNPLNIGISGNDGTTETTEATTEAGTESVSNTTEQGTTESASNNNQTGSYSKNGKSPVWSKNNNSSDDMAFPKPDEGDHSGSGCYISKDMMKYYLDGSWVMLKKGFPILDTEAVPNLLTFNSTKNKVKYTRGGDNQYAEFDFALNDLFGNVGGTSNLMTIKGTDVSSDFSDSSDMLVGSTEDFQIVIANAKGYDTLMIRPIGNGDSLFGTEGLGYDNASNGFWIFKKYNEVTEGYIEPKFGNINNINDSLMKKNQSFYAFLWADEGSRVYLEHMNAAEEQVNLYGEDKRVLNYNYENSEYPLSAVCYPIIDAEDYLHMESYSPGFVQVTTDENGYIISMMYCQYYIYGYYYPPLESEGQYPGGLDDDGKGPDEGQYPGGLDDDGKDPNEMDGDGPDGRDPSIFGYGDSTFLGSWTESELGSALAIVENDPQVGGYKLYFTFYAIGGASAVAYVDEGGGMCVYNVEASWDDGEFQGYITPTGDGGLSMFVTWSDIESVPEFSTYTYYPAE